MNAMCNRFRGVDTLNDLPRVYDFGRINFEYNPNVAPTESVPALLAERGQEVRVQMARFGIALGPTKTAGARPPLLNSRMDTLRNGSFRAMVADRHCIIPAQGFYEWREEGGNKQPYYFYRRDGKPILFAGIWSISEHKGDKMASFSILTDEPNELVAPYHDRMPVIVDDPEPWLALEGLDHLKPLGLEMFAVRPLSRAVNNVREKRIDIIEGDDPPVRLV
ncbi:MAG: hypothetical protein JWO78_227 [Micavibrio sp.]|nr:hypothetical protein [Micavibrio sp.]